MSSVRRVVESRARAEMEARRPGTATASRVGTCKAAAEEEVRGPGAAASSKGDALERKSPPVE
eukprot:scaffold183273_cov15-Tisochrysis_lutea.AAC.1